MTTKVFFASQNNESLDLLTPEKSGRWKNIERVSSSSDADFKVTIDKNYICLGDKQHFCIYSLPEGYDYDRLIQLECPSKYGDVSCVLSEETSDEYIQYVKKLAVSNIIDIYGIDRDIGGLSRYMGAKVFPMAYEKYKTTLVEYTGALPTDPILLWCKPICKDFPDIFAYDCRAPETFLTSNTDVSDNWKLKMTRLQILNTLNVWERTSQLVLGSTPEKVFPDMQVAKDGICLVMIVRDESHVIERCLESVVNILSSYLICDTGSLDNTPEIIDSYMSKHGVPGQVIHKEWKNFGYNKSYLLERAYKDNLSLGAKYLIWLDADEVFRNTKGKSLTVEDKYDILKFANARPNDGVFMVMTEYGGLEYQRWNMCRNNQLYKWSCPRHEWFHATVPTGTVFYDGITLLARKEGARTLAGDSGRKDVEAFKEHLREKPDCSRCHFYLGQTLRENGDLEGSLEMFNKRMTMPGYHQEKYIAAMYMGHIYLRLGRPEEAFDIWEKSWMLVRNRIEIPYYYMMALTRCKKYEDAFKVATRSYSIYKLNKHDLFVQKELYDWRFIMEYSVTAHYSKHHKQAFLLGQQLMKEAKYPDNQACIIESNMGYFRRAVNAQKEPSELSKQFNFHPPMVVIIDDFLPDPLEIRKFALSQDFIVKGNYPGLRTKPFGTPEHREAFEKILGTQITYWPTGVNSYNGAFQYTYGRHTSWIHRDATDYSAMIYLTPDPPADGGTLTYRHKQLKIERDSEAKSKEEIDQMNSDSSNEDKWEPMDTIANKFNRLIIFSGRRSHKSNKYFGSTRDNGRLFQTFFFNVEGFH